MDVMTKILIGFMDVQSFCKMLDKEKYTIKFACKWQYGGNCIEVFKDGSLVKEVQHAGERAIAKATGYDIILDHWAKRNGFEWRDDMADGGMHIQLSDAAQNMHPEPQQPLGEFEKRMERIRNEFIPNWNKMVAATKEYNINPI